MIRVKVDLVPYGDEGATKQIGELVLANVGTDYRNNARYRAVLVSDKETPVFVTATHDRDDGVWELLRRLLNEYESENFTEGSTEIEKQLLKRLLNA